MGSRLCMNRGGETDTRSRNDIQAGRNKVPKTARGCVNGRKGSRDRREKTDSVGADTKPTVGMNGIRI
jgi:hypothetical protein